jgi:integrase
LTDNGQEQARPRRRTADAPFGWLVVDHAKGSNRAVIPITAELRAAIDAMPTWPQTSPIQSLTYLRTRHGRARSDKALTGDFRQWCNAAGLPDDCTLHGLRHTGAHLIAESGGTAHEIMSPPGTNL